MKRGSALIFILSAFMLSSCTQKNKGEEEIKVTKDNFLDVKLNEYFEEHPDLIGFYTKGQGPINEFRKEDGKLYYIQYEFKDDEYVEKNRREAFMAVYNYPNNENWDLSVYLNPEGKNAHRINEEGKRYDTMEEAVMVNYKHNYGSYVPVKSVTASSTLEEKYSASNLIDGTYKSWVEGEEGSGIGCKIEIEFERPYYFEEYTNYACIDIVNGFGDVKYFNQNNRVKDMNLWIDDDPTPVKITLYDRHRAQTVVLSKYIGKRFVKKFTFEILSVYPGTKYDDTCIAEIHIGPFDWDAEPMTLDPYQAEILYAYYRDLENSEALYRFKNGVLEYHDIDGHDPTGEWMPLRMMPGYFRQVEFDFDGETPIIIRPGAVQNQKDIDENWQFDEMDMFSCEPMYKDYKLYAYKNGGWKEYKNPELTAEIDKVFEKQKGKYFTFSALEKWSRLNSGVNDGEDPNYSIKNSWFFKNFSFTFYDEMHVMFRDDKSSHNGLESWWYEFAYDGKKYFLKDSSE
ncbi:MAG: hypothetical protein ILP07_13590 [Treponema sp.]|nr:hypothetical protein [Treponema sp.]